MPPRVLVVYNGYAPNDPDAVYSAQSVNAMGYSVHLMGTARQNKEPIPTSQQIGSIRVTILPFQCRLNLQWLWRWLLASLPPTVQPADNSVSTFISIILFNLWVLRVGLQQRYTVVHCHDLAPLPACWLLGRLQRGRVIYHAREDFPTRYRGRKAVIVERLERWLAPRADAVISAGIRLKAVLEGRGARDVVHIGNWKRLEDYDVSASSIQAKRQAHGIRDDEIVIVYIGTLEPTRELLPLLDAVARRPDVRLLIGGRGTMQDAVQARAQQHPNITWLGWVPLAEVPVYTLLANALYCVLAKGEYTHENERCPSANKLYESYAAGIPLIARRDINEMADELRTNGAGILVDDASFASLSAAFDLLRDRELISRISQRALAEAQKYNWAEAERRLRHIYDRLAAL